MRLIDADALDKVKFHPLPYTHITPFDADAESYKRGWNDAIDAIMSNAPSAQPDVPDTNDGDMISRQAAIDANTRAVER